MLTSVARAVYVTLWTAIRDWSFYRRSRRHLASLEQGRSLSRVKRCILMGFYCINRNTVVNGCGVVDVSRRAKGGISQLLPSKSRFLDF